MNPRVAESDLADEYVRQLEHIRRRMRAYEDGHTGLQLAAVARMADLMRMGRWDDIRRIACSA